jgi:serine/threonine protein kinase
MQRSSSCQRHFGLTFGLRSGNMSPSKMLSLIRKEKFSFPDAEWSNVSDEAKDLISGLLAIDAKKRLTVIFVLVARYRGILTCRLRF